MPVTKISENSWKGILSVQEEAYTGVPPEDVNVLKSKWKASPETCFLFQTDDKDIVAYLLAHSWNSSEPPKLFKELPENLSGDVLYLHDLAVATRGRGLGVGKKLFKKLLETATSMKFKMVLLVAVQGSEGFWLSLGFLEVKNVTVCPSYGVNAKLMSLVTEI